MNLESLKKIVLSVLNARSLNKTYRRYKKTTKIKRLDRAKKKEIKEYYKTNFGISVPTKYHELIYSMCGIYKKEYMPFTVYCDLLETLSPYKYRKVLDDKVLYDLFLSNVRLPERIASCCEGVTYYYHEDGKKEQISFDILLNNLSNLEDCIIKPSKGSSAGIGVKCFSTVNGVLKGEEETLTHLLNSYHGNFVIEKRIINNENLKSLNPSSCNTLRIHTWRDRSSSKIEFVSAFLRVGRSGSVVDNGFAGGIAIPIGNNGILSNSGCTLKSYKRIDCTDTGITFKGYQIEQFDEMVAVAKKGHTNLPHFDFIGWDITVDKDGNVVVIEFNADPDMRLDQLIFLDTCLLDKQEAILSEVYKRIR